METYLEDTAALCRHLETELDSLENLGSGYADFIDSPAGSVRLSFETKQQLIDYLIQTSVLDKGAEARIWLFESKFVLHLTERNIWSDYDTND